MLIGKNYNCLNIYLLAFSLNVKCSERNRDRCQTYIKARRLSRSEISESVPSEIEMVRESLSVRTETNCRLYCVYDTEHP